MILENKIRNIVREELQSIINEEDSSVLVIGYKKQKFQQKFPNKEAYERWKDGNDRRRDDDLQKVIVQNVEYGK